MAFDKIPNFYDPLKAGSIDGTDTVPHDHGIIRAMEAVYKPNKLVTGDPKSTVFVGRLNISSTEEDLTSMFSQCGNIKKLRLIRDLVTGHSKGYAFVEFKERRDASRALDLSHTVLDDREILVLPECERLLKGWVPRRLGGGFSGKKESGQLRFGGVERPFYKPILIQEHGRGDRKRDRFQEGRHHGRDRYERDEYHGRDRSYRSRRD